MAAAAREMLELYPGDKSGPRYLGISFALDGDSDAAGNCYQQARRAGLKKATWAWVMNNVKSLRANQYLNSGNYQAAEAALREAIRYDDRANWSWNNLGFALERQGKLEEAAKCYAQALRLDPKD